MNIISLFYLLILNLLKFSIFYWDIQLFGQPLMELLLCHELWYSSDYSSEIPSFFNLDFLHVFIIHYLFNQSRKIIII
jgi:hypothetical protein